MQGQNKSKSKSENKSKSKSKSENKSKSKNKSKNKSKSENKGPAPRCSAKEKAKDYGVRRQSVAATALWPCAERLQSLTKRAEEIR